MSYMRHCLETCRSQIMVSFLTRVIGFERSKVRHERGPRHGNYPHLGADGIIPAHYSVEIYGWLTIAANAGRPCMQKLLGVVRRLTESEFWSIR